MIDKDPPTSQLAKYLRPEQEWRILVLAAEYFSLALELAPHVNHVTMVCPTVMQAKQVEVEAANSHLSNIACWVHDPEELHYANDSFDLLVCDQMTHTIYDLGAWLLEVDRILCPQGLLAIAANLVPGTRLRGKKARRLHEAAAYLNAFYQLRSQKRYRCYSKNHWEDLLVAAGFEIQQLETADKFSDFTVWADKDYLSSEDRLRLKVMLVQAPEKANEFLTTQISGDRIVFRHPEIIILAKSKANTD